MWWGCVHVWGGAYTCRVVGENLSGGAAAGCQAPCQTAHAEKASARVSERERMGGREGGREADEAVQRWPRGANCQRGGLVWSNKSSQTLQNGKCGVNADFACSGCLHPSLFSTRSPLLLASLRVRYSPPSLSGELFSTPPLRDRKSAYVQGGCYGLKSIPLLLGGVRGR